MFRTILKIAGATLAFCVVHSLCASPPVKRAARQLAGERNYRGWYRAFYTIQSAVTLGILIAYICAQPNHVLYRALGRWKWLLRTGQALSLLAQIHTAFQVGVWRITGADNLWGWLRGNARLLPAAEGQGPSLGIYANGDRQLHLTGFFRATRHPLNFFALPLLWLQTPMTVRWASFSSMASLYFYVGSYLEAERLRRYYGPLYQNYERSRTPFFAPTLRALPPPPKPDEDADDTI